MSEKKRLTRIDRRRFLKLAALVTGISALPLVQACTQEAPAPAQPPAAPQPTAAPAVSQPTAAPQPATQPAASTRPVSMAVATPRSPNYALWYGTGSVLATLPWILMGLARQNPLGEFEPWLASSYEVQDGGRSVAIKLRPEARWSDGRPVTADDVVWTWELFTAPWIFGTDSPYWGRLGVAGAKEFNQGTADRLSGVEIVDPHTIVARLDPPKAIWPILEPIEWGILPRHVFGDTPKENLKDHPFIAAPTVNSGPYRFVKYELDQYIEMQRWDDWWGNSIWKQPQITQIFAKQLAPDTVVLQLERGELDIGAIPGAEVARLERMPHLEIHRVPSLGSLHFFEINQRREYLQDKRVRQAFDYALDKNAMIQTVFHGVGIPAATTVMGPDWAVNPNIQPRPHDPARARELLQEANWDFNRALTFLAVGGSPGQRTGEMFQHYLEEIGVKLELQLITAAVLVPEIDKGEFDFSTNGGGFFARDPSENKWYLNVRRRLNWMPAELEQLLADGEATADIAQRAPIYHRVAEILHDETPVIHIGRGQMVWGVNRDLDGYTPFVMTTHTGASLLDWRWK